MDNKILLVTNQKQENNLGRIKMASYLGIGLAIIGLILAIIGAILVFTHGKTPQDPVAWWMWGLLALGAILFIVGLLIWFFTPSTAPTTTI